MKSSCWKAPRRSPRFWSWTSEKFPKGRIDPGPWGILKATEKRKLKKRKIILDIFEISGIILTVPCDTEDLCNGSTPDSDSVCGGSNPSSSARKKHLRNRKCFFQRNPPLWVGEILLRSVKYAKGRVKSLRRWVDFLSLSAKRKISQVRQHLSHILPPAKYFTERFRFAHAC